MILPSDKFNVVFAGNLGLAQGLPSILSAAQILKNNGVKANIIIVGSGLAKADAVTFAKENNIDNVIFLPRVPITEIGDILQQADALLVHLIKDDLFTITIPSRTQAYLACGKPIVMAVDGDAADLVRNASAGIICSSDSPISISSGIEQLTLLSKNELKEMGENGAKYYYSELSLQEGVKKFITIFKKVIQ